MTGLCKDGHTPLRSSATLTQCHHCHKEVGDDEGILTIYSNMPGKQVNMSCPRCAAIYCDHHRKVSQCLKCGANVPKVAMYCERCVAHTPRLTTNA